VQGSEENSNVLSHSSFSNICRINVIYLQNKDNDHFSISVSKSFQNHVDIYLINFWSVLYN